MNWEHLPPKQGSDSEVKFKIKKIEYNPYHFKTMEEFIFDLSMNNIDWTNLKGANLKNFQLIAHNIMARMSHRLKEYGYRSHSEFREAFSMYLPNLINKQAKTTKFVLDWNTNSFEKED